MPWMKLGEIPSTATPTAGSGQMHIYERPFYYIDYCLARTAALEFWAAMQADRDSAWRRYLAPLRLAGTETFSLMASAGLDTPFGDNALRVRRRGDLAGVGGPGENWCKQFCYQTACQKFLRSQENRPDVFFRVRPSLYGGGNLWLKDGPRLRRGETPRSGWSVQNRKRLKYNGFTKLSTKMNVQKRIICINYTSNFDITLREGLCMIRRNRGGNRYRAGRMRKHGACPAEGAGRRTERRKGMKGFAEHFVDDGKNFEVNDAALVIVDMLNDFCKEGGRWSCPRAGDHRAHPEPHHGVPGEEAAHHLHQRLPPLGQVRQGVREARAPLH